MPKLIIFGISTDFLRQFCKSFSNSLTGSVFNANHQEEYFRSDRESCIRTADYAFSRCTKQRVGHTLTKPLVQKSKLNDLLNRQIFHGWNCVHFACAMNYVNALQKMIEYGADVNVRDSNGDTPLHLAIQHGNDDCVSALLDATSTAWDQEIVVDLSVVNDSGYTPLHLASMKNNVNVVIMLFCYRKHCPSIFDDVDRKHGNNALHIAIQSNAYDVAEFLMINKCISPLKMNGSGHTALYLAQRASAMDLVDLMKQYTPVNDDDLMHNNADYDESDSEEESSYNVRQFVELTFRSHHNKHNF